MQKTNPSREIRRSTTLTTTQCNYLLLCDWKNVVMTLNYCMWSQTKLGIKQFEPVEPGERGCSNCQFVVEYKIKVQKPVT